GVERIYHPNDGMKMGLVEMIEDVVARAEGARRAGTGRRETGTGVLPGLGDEIGSGRVLSALEEGEVDEAELDRRRHPGAAGAPGSRSPFPVSASAPVIGITGTGGAGKSSVTDELLNRFLAHFPEMRIAVISVDPTRRRTGGALLGDRIRMNSLRSHRVYM